LYSPIARRMRSTVSGVHFAVIAYSGVRSIRHWRKTDSHPRSLRRRAHKHAPARVPTIL
jgi:hypothetical protein